MRYRILVLILLLNGCVKNSINTTVDRNVIAAKKILRLKNGIYPIKTKEDILGGRSVEYYTDIVGSEHARTIALLSDSNYNYYDVSNRSDLDVYVHRQGFSIDDTNLIEYVNYYYNQSHYISTDVIYQHVINNKEGYDSIIAHHVKIDTMNDALLSVNIKSLDSVSIKENFYYYSCYLLDISKNDNSNFRIELKSVLVKVELNGNITADTTSTLLKKFISVNKIKF